MQAVLSSPICFSVNAMFKRILNEKMAAVQFHNAFWVYIRRLYNEPVALLCGYIENGTFFCEETHGQTVIADTV